MQPFMHELDFRDGNFNDAPLMESGRASARWTDLLASAFEAHRTAVDGGGRRPSSSGREFYRQDPAQYA